MDTPDTSGPMVISHPEIGEVRVDRKVTRAFDRLMEAAADAGMTRNQLFVFTATALGIDIERRD